MKFGVSIPSGWTLDLARVEGAASKWATLRDYVVEAEALGFSSAWIVDHFHTFPRKVPEATFEAFTTLTALAAATSRIRLGPLVACAGYRNPALLAKEVACLDVISGGRVTLGLGAGWYQEEYGAYGFDFPRIGVRLAQLAETCEITTALLAEGRITYEGKYFKLVDAICEPRPLQKPRPPLLIGGGGERVLLRQVARYADAWNCNVGFDEYRRKLGILHQHCRDLGRDPQAIELTVALPFAIVDRAEEIDGVLAERLPPEIPVSVLRKRYERVDPLFGTPEEVARGLRRWIDLGIGTLICQLPDPVSRSQLRRLAKEVLPLL
jgi:F420-dependent oxidoreductase-like protein